MKSKKFYIVLLVLVLVISYIMLGSGFIRFDFPNIIINTNNYNNYQINDNEIKDDKNIGTDDNIKDGIYIDDIYIGNNMTVSDLKSKFDIEYSDNLNFILRDETIKLRIMTGVTIYVSNPSNKSISIEDGIIAGVIASDEYLNHLKIYNNHHLYPKYLYYGNIYISNDVSYGSSRGDIINFFGEPSTDYSGFFYKFGFIGFNDDYSVDSILVNDISYFYK